MEHPSNARLYRPAAFNAAEPRPSTPVVTSTRAAISSCVSARLSVLMAMPARFERLASDHAFPPGSFADSQSARNTAATTGSSASPAASCWTFDTTILSLTAVERRAQIPARRMPGARHKVEPGIDHETMVFGDRERVAGAQTRAQSPSPGTETETGFPHLIPPWRVWGDCASPFAGAMDVIETEQANGQET